MPPMAPATRAAGAIGSGVNASLEVLTPAALAALAPSLQSRSTLPIVATRGAAPGERTQEERALVVLAAAPVRAPDGRLLGHVQGGVLLNRNLPFIDHINAIVYPQDSLPFGSQGTASLFLDDVRISTNVRLFGNERAIGTRASQAVRDSVLGEGRTWLQRAFVVNDWYVSGYQPLHDATGRRIGMLYVGYLERPFAQVKYAILAGIGLVFLLAMAVAAQTSLRWARGIFRPLEQMTDTMRRVAAGGSEARVGALDSADEIGQLAGHLDHLLDVVDDKTRALQRWNSALDAKVAERTRELELSNASLKAAQQQVVRSEKLAAIGQLTAGIAHELNNPIAVLQGNLDLLRELLGADAGKVRDELALIDEQAERMRMLMTQLLQFARPTEYAAYVEKVEPAAALDEALVLVAHLLRKSRIEVRRDYASRRAPVLNRRELQQVLVNLLVNAVHAMPDGGTLLLATRDRDDAIEISIADSGPGLGDELLAQVFEPFVTRKAGGTGLGLWISRMLVERYGGDLRAANRGDGATGAVFSVLLPAEEAADPLSSGPCSPSSPSPISPRPTPADSRP
jgi:two-component system, NtrC family, sensor kinase